MKVKIFLISAPNIHSHTAQRTLTQMYPSIPVYVCLCMRMAVAHMTLPHSHVHTARIYLCIYSDYLSIGSNNMNVKFVPLYAVYTSMRSTSRADSGHDNDVKCQKHVAAMPTKGDGCAEKARELRRNRWFFRLCECQRSPLHTENRPIGIRTKTIWCCVSVSLRLAEIMEVRGVHPHTNRDQRRCDSDKMQI